MNEDNVMTTTIPERTPEMIAQHIRSTLITIQQFTLMGVIEIGKSLAEVKELVPHGEWDAWLQANVNFSTRSARDYMRVFREYGSRHIPLDLGFSNALKLLALPEDDREFLIEASVDGAVSVDELSAEIDKFRARDEESAARIGELEIALADSGRRNTEYRILADEATDKAKKEAAYEVARVKLSLEDECEREKYLIQQRADAKIRDLQSQLNEARNVGSPDRAEILRSHAELLTELWHPFERALMFRRDLDDDDLATSLAQQLRDEIYRMLARIDEYEGEIK